MGSFKLFLSAVSLLVLAIPFAFTQSSDPFPMPLCNGYIIEEVDIDTLQSYLSENLTSVQLTKCLIDRISQLNPYLGYTSQFGYTNPYSAVIEINPDALDIAAASDAERKAGIIQGPLHGIPFLVKDNIGSKDKMQTTAGSMA